MRLVYLNLFSSGPEDDLMVEQALKRIAYIDKMLHMPSVRDKNAPKKSHNDGMKVKLELYRKRFLINLMSRP